MERARPRRHRHETALAVSALGVVFGDIGTSPLYALRECLRPDHGLPMEPAAVLGVLSLLVWSLVLIGLNIWVIWALTRPGAIET